jgi:hypothetical protein
MAFLIQSGIHLSIDGTTWYKLTDHNREPIQMSVELIESQSRMANGKMRKYVIAQKNKISTSWKFVPSVTNLIIDQQEQNADINYAAGWLESFYKANAAIPIYLKVISSEHNTEPTVGNVPSSSGNNFKTSAELSGLNTASYTNSQESTAISAQASAARPNATGSKIYNVFMTDFSKTIINRTKNTDYVDMSIEFTEI